MESDVQVTPVAWSPAGNVIVFQRRDPASGLDIWILPLSGDHKPLAFQNSGAIEQFSQVSPDGKWIAYTSDETGSSQIFVRSFPSGPGKRIVSTDGGSFARWRGDGKELFYVRGPQSGVQLGLGTLMAVEFRANGPGLELGLPKDLFENNYLNPGRDPGGNYQVYAVSFDGQRFLIPRAASSTESDVMPDPIVVILNWPSTLKN